MRGDAFTLSQSPSGSCASSRADVYTLINAGRVCRLSERLTFPCLRSLFMLKPVFEGGGGLSRRRKGHLPMPRIRRAMGDMVAVSQSA